MPNNHTNTSLNTDLLEVAFFPPNTPACARIQDPVHTLRIYWAPGAWSFMNCKTEDEMTPGRAPEPVDITLEDESRRSLPETTARDEDIVLGPCFDFFLVSWSRHYAWATRCFYRLESLGKISRLKRVWRWRDEFLGILGENWGEDKREDLNGTLIIERGDSGEETYCKTEGFSHGW